VVRPHLRINEIPRFIGDEDKDEINLMEWLRMVKKYCKTPFWASLNFMVNLASGGIALMKVLDSPPHGKILKNSSQINGSRIQIGLGDV
jgi:hypothetical protein